MDDSVEQYAGYEPAPDGTYVITGVETQRARATRRSIFVNGEFALGVSEETYVRFALYTGRVVTPAFLKEVRSADELYRCKEAALMLHNYRMRSRREMEKRLTDKGYSPEAVAATLEFLAGYNMLNDEQFARALVSQQLLKRPVGRRRLADELRRRGVGKEEIEGTMSSAVSDEEELANAFAAAAKKARTLRQSDRVKWERSLANFLAARGFGWEVIGKVLAHYRTERGAGETAMED